MNSNYKCGEDTDRKNTDTGRVRVNNLCTDTKVYTRAVLWTKAVMQKEESVCVLPFYLQL